MPVGLYLNPPTLTEAIYFEVVGTLQSSGTWPPEGLLHHSCFTEGPERLAIFEIWESEEAMQRIAGERLLPLLQELSVDVGPPAIVGIVNLIQP